MVWSPTSILQSSNVQIGSEIILNEIKPESKLIPNEIDDEDKEEIAFGLQDMTVSFHDRAMVGEKYIFLFFFAFNWKRLTSHELDYSS
jgi:hypothetical protein